MTEHRRANVVAVCDTDLARAYSLAERYRGSQVFSSFQDMLESGTIDVLHVVTPPVLHYQHAVAAIEAGIHVLVEKPLALSAVEVKDLYARAAEKKVKLCPDFIQLFHPAVRKVSELIATGQFGPVIHVEIFMGVESALSELREWPGTHWSFQLPGGVLHNYITHPLYLASNWLGPAQCISVKSRSYGVLQRGLTDHVHIVMEGERANASLTVSFAMSQGPYFLKLYCVEGSLLVNFDTMSVLVHSTSRLPRPARRLLQNVAEAQQLIWGTLMTACGVLTRRVVPYEGLRTLVSRFYDSIESGTPPPISEDLVLNTAKAEEFVAGHTGKVRLNLNGIASNSGTSLPSVSRVLVTGASGFVGKALVRKLVDSGYYVRAYVRPLSNTSALETMGAEIVHGDIRECASLRRAAEGMDFGIHLAAGVRGSRQFAYSSCVEGTRNIADVARACGIKRVIYVSSMAIYDFLALRDGENIREDSPLEPYRELRSTYAYAKCAAEEVALSHIGDREPAWTVVRPSLIFGAGWDPISAVGVRIGSLVVSFGARHKILRLIHVDDVCEALLSTMRSPETAGRVMNLSHPEVLKLEEYVRRYVQKWNPGLRILYMPASLFMAGGWLGELLFRLLRRPPIINRRRMAYLVRSNQVDATAVRSLGIWGPSDGIRQQLGKEVAIQVG
jgi:predicted dehydrogenase/nucleoside-diphosphate-sugar epimerase